jgi:hypothetical protein
MARYVVYVERKVRQYRTVVVEADSEDTVMQAKKKVFDLACSQPDWIYDDCADDAHKCSKIECVEITEEEPDMVLCPDCI